MDSLLRYFDMLCLIPKAPHSISTPELQEKLQSTGYDVDLRTVQRDLVKLTASPLFPISSTENTKPLRWFWIDNSSHLQFPLMSTDEALTFKLAEMFLDPLLPPSVRLRLSGYFDLADKRLKESKFEHWVEKVNIVPSNLSLVPAEIEPNLLAVVYESLLKQRRFKANYRPIDRKAKSYEINPLGLVFKNNIIYLVATVFEYTDIKQFALHRFRSAELMDKPANAPEKFNLKSYIDNGGFDYPIDNIFGKIDIKLRINRFIKQLLTETPLNINQHISEFDEVTYILNATVKDTEQLRWWIRSFGTGIEVLEPSSLREEFAKEVRTLSAMYGLMKV